MRLANGQGPKGLIGIKSPANIPECYGIHGVYESSRDSRTLEGDVVRERRTTVFSSTRSRALKGSQIPIESGGIQVYRPFLDFSKAQLIATCVAESIPWFEDDTNGEPTLTMRNAIRHMCINHSMPAALSKPALLALSIRLNDRAAQRFDIMRAWLSKCKITRFETRTGTVQVCFADLAQFQRSGSVCQPREAGLIAAELLRQIILLVTPQEHVDLRSLYNAVRHIFPEISQLKEKNSQITAFTASGVYFQPIQRFNSPSPSLTFLPKTSEWHLSRQPYTSKFLPEVQIDVPVHDSLWWSPWQLYDGRYWIRLHDPKSFPLFVRPFQPEHLARFRASLAKSDRLKLVRLLKEKAPGNVRWTLPAILNKGGDGRETVLALPSLGLSIFGCMVRWEIRYKKIRTELFALQTPGQDGHTFS